MARKNKKAAHRDDAVTFGELKSPNEVELEAVKECRKRTKLWRVLIVIALICAPLALLMGASNTATVSDAVEEAKTITANTSIDKPGKNAAVQAVYQWLTSTNTPFPNESGWTIMWDGAQKTNEYTQTDGDTKTVVQTWVHTFSCTGTTGVLHRITQATTVQGDIATAVGTPSILPEDVTSTSGDTSTGAPQGYRSLENASQLDALVTAWAKSYVGKNASAFTVLVADPDINHVYQPANVGTLDTASINWGVWQNKEADGTNNGNYAVINVTITFKPYENTNLNSQQNTDTTQTRQAAKTELNLLVADPTSGAAKIVDWGASGEITSLKPYANALQKNLVKTSTGEENDEDADTTGDTDTQTTTPESENTPSPSLTPNLVDTGTSVQPSQTNTPTPTE